jgi:hypothetical protein
MIEKLNILNFSQKGGICVFHIILKKINKQKINDINLGSDNGKGSIIYEVRTEILYAI